MTTATADPANRGGEEQQIVHRPDEVSCEPEMPVLDFARIWRIADA